MLNQDTHLSMSSIQNYYANSYTERTCVVLSAHHNKHKTNPSEVTFDNFCTCTKQSKNTELRYSTKATKMILWFIYKTHTKVFA